MLRGLNMFNIAKLYKRHTHVLPENRRIIAEQRAQIDPFAIISIDEFLEKIVKPQLEVGGVFQSFFEKHANRIEKTLFHWINFDQFETFNVRFEMMSDNDQEIMRRRYALKTDAEKTNEELLKEIKDLFNDEIDESNLLENRDYPTLYLAHIIQAIDAVAKTKGSLIALEKKSINLGHAQTVLNFWWEINNLKDYSTFFPHKPKPKGNDTDNDGGKEWSIDLGGLFPGQTGWKPA